MIMELGNVTNSNLELLRRLPPVLRVRDFHLYLEGGRRLTDLWQLGGMAVLGHKPPKLLKELKNSAERGLFAPFPHPMEKRFLKALARLFPSPQLGFRLYGSQAALEAALNKAGFSGNNEAHVSLWRPFLNGIFPPEKAEPSLYIPILPWIFSPQVLILDKSQENCFPQGDLLSPLILAPATRAIYDLIAAGKDGGRPKYQKINKALSKKGCKWQRQGIYFFRIPEAQKNWEPVWEYFLEKGFLLPPSSHEPLILPGLLSQGEEKKLADLLEEPA